MTDERERRSCAGRNLCSGAALVQRPDAADEVCDGHAAQLSQVIWVFGGR